MATSTKLSLEQKRGIIKKAFLASSIPLAAEKTISLTHGKASVFDVTLHGRAVQLYLLVKMVAGSGWSWRPDILRVQVPSLEEADIPLTRSSALSAIMGIAFVDEHVVFALWNPGMYVFHKTNRSCYVSKKMLAKAVEDGFVGCQDHGQYVMVASENNLQTLFDNYLSQNAVEVLP